MIGRSSRRGVRGAEERAFRSAERVAALRAELEVTAEQIAALRWDADDAEIDSVVRDTADARRAHAEAVRHAAALERLHADQLVRLRRAEQQHAALVDSLFPDTSDPGSPGDPGTG